MSQLPKSKTVAIIYGFTEGPFMGRSLRRALTGAGHTVVRDPQTAEVVIAHSGGCFLIPPPGTNQKIIMVGLPYWPDRSILGAICQKVWLDIQAHRREGAFLQWLHKTSWNARYFWNMPANIRMLRGRSQGNHWSYPNVTLVRYVQDTICTPDVASLPFTIPPAVVELPGQHDDCWRVPEPIVDIVQS